MQPDWSAEVHRELVAAGVRVVGYVPDAGHKRLIELCQADVPVFIGAEKPLLRPYQNATWFHGRDGLGEHNYPAPRRAPEKMHAVDAIIDTIEANPGLVMVTLGPLTNIALALARKPARCRSCRSTRPPWDR